MSGDTKLIPTPEQQKAIEARGQNLLLNAGAGAGKTSTLTQRVIGRMMDPRERLRLEQLVIVTFTRAAATEMRERIAKALRKCLEDTEIARDAAMHTHLAAEVQSLPRAQISTLHSYCATLLREFGDQVGLPPDFELIDPDEGLLLHIDRLREEMDRVAVDPIHGPLLRDALTQLSPVKGADELQQILMRVQDFLSSLDDPEDFVRRVLSEMTLLDSDESFEDSTWYRLLSEPALDAASSLEETLKDFLHQTRTLSLQSKGPMNVQAAAEDRLKVMQSLATHRDLPGICSFLSQKGFLPTRSKPSDKNIDDVRHHELSGVLKEAVDAAAKIVAPIAKLGSLAEIRANLKDSMAFLPLLLEWLGLDFNRQLMAEHIEMRRLRFSDLERLTLQLLEDESGQPTRAARAIRERTSEILVDEFQDVNGLQARLLAAIARPPDHDEGGNLFIVGDLKQSIYGFRQADPRKFKQLYGEYHPYRPESVAEPGARIDLVANYRSRPELLALLNPFFQRLFSDQIGGLEFDASHQFVSGRVKWDSPLPSPSVEILLIEKLPEGDDAPIDSSQESEGEIESDNDQEGGQFDKESLAVAAEIQRLHSEGVPYKEVAVLTRTGKAAATKLAEVFQQAHIPYHTEAATGFLEQQEVLDFKAVLLVLDNPFDDVALVGVLRGPIGDWNEDEIASLRIHQRSGSLIDSLLDLSRDTESAIGAKAAQLQDRLQRWRLAARRRPMGELFTKILEETSLMAKVEALPNGKLRRLNLLYLVERAVQFDAFQRKGLREFLNFLDRLSENEKDLGTPPASPASLEAVRIMTVHKSKGLEFPVVIIPFLGTRFNTKDLTTTVIWDRDLGVACGFLRGRKWGHDDENCGRILLTPAIRDRLLSEELRLLYVAMTRAEQRLILIGSRAAPGEKKSPDKMSLAEAVRQQVASDCSAPPEQRRRKVAKAGCPLDWVLLGFADRPELRDVGDQEPTSDSSLRVRIIPSTQFREDDKDQESIIHKESEQALQVLESERDLLSQMIERVNALSDRREGIRIKGKVTATEAKRIYDLSLEPEEDRDDESPVRWMPPLPDRSDLPDWWPPSLAQRQVTSGKERGIIQHKFMEKVELGSISDLESLTREADRMVRDGILTAEEAELIDHKKLHDTLTLDPFGPTLLARHHTARRELPFKVGIPAREIIGGVEIPNDIVILQGIIDFIYEDAQGRLVVVDWKTDRWDGTAARLDYLTEAYTPQIKLYIEGLKRATNREVAGGWLVFLQASQPVWIPPAQTDEDWLKIIRPAICLPA
jgi:ATP-dependent helicase/nuclease subunit A